MKVRFLADFDWKPVPAVTIAFSAGMVRTVTQACARQAIAHGRAVAVNEAVEATEPAPAATPRARRRKTP